MNLLKRFLQVVFIVVMVTGCIQKKSEVYNDFLQNSDSPDKSILPDFSYAGYHFGNKEVPRKQLDVFNVIDFGAIPDDDKSDEPAIKSAIAKAEENGGGIVFFPEGHYLVNTNRKEQNDYIIIQSSNIVLRGEGPEKTVIEFKKRSGQDVITSGLYKFRFQRVDDHNPAFKHASLKLSTEFITKVKKDVNRESFSVEVEDASQLEVGQWVTLNLPPTGERGVKLFYTQPYSFPKAQEEKEGYSWYQGKIKLSERHLIKEINGNILTFHAPIHIPVIAEHGWEIHTFPHLEEVGVEGIHFKGNWKGYYPGNYRLLIKKKAYSPLMMSACVNSWVKNCYFSEYNLGMRFYNLSRCSIIDVKMFGTGSNRGRHNIFLQNCNGVFIGKLQDFQANQDGTSVLHGSIGNVFWYCKNEETTPMDLHAAYPYGNLYDNVHSSFKRKAGSGTGSYGGYNPQHLGKLVLWNHIYSGKDTSLYPFWNSKDFYGAKHQFYVMPIIVGMHGNPIRFNPSQCEVLESMGNPVTPQSLYEAQIKLRQGKLPDWLSELKQIKFFDESPGSGKYNDKIIVHADFDHGSIDYLEEVSENHLEGRTNHWEKHDGVGDQYYWFYYRLSNIKGKTITTVLNDLKGVYRGNPHIIYTDYTRPVISYDNTNWDRIEKVDYDVESYRFTFTHTFVRDTAWVAYAHPYSYLMKEELIASLKDNQYVNAEIIGNSVYKRAIHLLTITDRSITDKDKKVILINAVQHPGEDCGAFLAEGLINYLISDDEHAARIREKIVFKIIPMMNPDGVYFGTSRYNMKMRDLNSDWGNDVSDINDIAEINSVKKWTEQWLNENKLHMVLDFHSHSQQIMKNTMHAPGEKVLYEFAKVLNNYWPVEHLSRMSKGRMRAYYYFEHDVDAAVIELTQSKSTKEGAYLTIEDYKKYGADLAKAIYEYYSFDD